VRWGGCGALESVSLPWGGERNPGLTHLSPGRLVPGAPLPHSKVAQFPLPFRVRTKVLLLMNPPHKTLGFVSNFERYGGPP